MAPDAGQIPNRSLFRQPEVCELAQVQPYVLRSWEAEFQDLGVAKVQGGPRVYRKADVERVLKIKHLLFVEGLTLAGARRRLQEEQGAPAPDGGALDDLLTSDARERILSVRKTLRELSAMLAGRPVPGDDDFALEAPVAKRPPPPGERIAGESRGESAGKEGGEATVRRNMEIWELGNLEI